MLDPGNWIIASLPMDSPPQLTIIVDTEEEFDWSKPHSRANICVDHIRSQFRAHKIYGRYGIKPTYVVDYPVATQSTAYMVLRDLYQSGLCDIGAHLHPWVNPPFDESVSVKNSYPGNLSHALEYAKLARLTEAIEESFGISPTIYRAGRWGVGPATTRILETLGYEIDTSVVPRTDFRPDQGPNFTHCGPHPYWFGFHHRLLELPLTVGFTGILAGQGRRLHDLLHTSIGHHSHLPGLFSRLRLFDRIRLSPEGITLSELCRLAREMYQAGIRIFSLTYHSPSLVPGNLPYVRNHRELDGFLSKIDRFIEFFMTELNGRPATPQTLRKQLLTTSPPRKVTW